MTDKKLTTYYNDTEMKRFIDAESAARLKGDTHFPITIGHSHETVGTVIALYIDNQKNLGLVGRVTDPAAVDLMWSSILENRSNGKPDMGLSVWADNSFYGIRDDSPNAPIPFIPVAAATREMTHVSLVANPAYADQGTWVSYSNIHPLEFFLVFGNVMKHSVHYMNKNDKDALGLLSKRIAYAMHRQLIDEKGNSTGSGNTGAKQSGPSRPAYDPFNPAVVSYYEYYSDEGHESETAIDNGSVLAGVLKQISPVLPRQYAPEGLFTGSWSSPSPSAPSSSSSESSAPSSTTAPLASAVTEVQTHDIPPTEDVQTPTIDSTNKTQELTTATVSETTQPTIPSPATDQPVDTTTDNMGDTEAQNKAGDAGAPPPAGSESKPDIPLGEIPPFKPDEPRVTNPVVDAARQAQAAAEASQSQKPPNPPPQVADPDAMDDTEPRRGNAKRPSPDDLLPKKPASADTKANAKDDSGVEYVRMTKADADRAAEALAKWDKLQEEKREQLISEGKQILDEMAAQKIDPELMESLKFLIGNKDEATARAGFKVARLQIEAASQRGASYKKDGSYVRSGPEAEKELQKMVEDASVANQAKAAGKLPPPPVSKPASTSAFTVNLNPKPFELPLYRLSSASSAEGYHRVSNEIQNYQPQARKPAQQPASGHDAMDVDTPNNSRAHEEDSLASRIEAAMQRSIDLQVRGNRGHSGSAYTYEQDLTRAPRTGAYGSRILAAGMAEPFGETNDVVQLKTVRVNHDY